MICPLYKMQTIKDNSNGWNLGNVNCDTDQCMWYKFCSAEVKPQLIPGYSPGPIQPYQVTCQAKEKH